ncbi:2-polyprenyl-6-methoxyphenol hydroxylase-like FAD-dependent oxidoreductase [Stackebrandtia albiflava]|uniref:2-polyprenyl-6-methoxyphenol hydroxylase-like FAD-dependent oxidoreductase n=1 Tax=Stackebrandtia albiflava TaxID=406432 RepID=A0A562UR39_9ACTN|nr:FAD-dependent monooxygenase [Stackebrandtia albiflava]TWJ08077.1 2-polyprenyl-6-methoxyphenol hydroxylase-like FAD-dependent oxidoreductase [Stackebrandtia albiflava]
MNVPAPAGSVAVIGGSISGCAAAVAAHKAGHRVTVFERSAGDLAERGFGVCIPEPLMRQSLDAGYLSPDLAHYPITYRVWLAREAGGDHRLLWRQHARMISLNWGLLWKTLRDNVPADAYRPGHTVVEVTGDDTGADLRLSDGTSHRFDLVVGADGYKSIVRTAIAPEAAPDYAGYVTWRGVVDLPRLTGCDTAVALLDDAAVTVGFDGGHSIMYRIPDGRGGHRVNWLVYTRPPADIDVGMSMSYTSQTLLDRLSTAFETIVDRVLPTEFARIVHQTPAADRAFQPIFDMKLERSARHPFVLAGDAATITRPHTASGATKALQDGLCLERRLTAGPDLPTALAGYDEERNAAGNALVDLGRRLGRDQVEATPDWLSMDAARMEEWTNATVAGHDLYIYARQPR